MSPVCAGNKLPEGNSVRGEERDARVVRRMKVLAERIVEAGIRATEFDESEFGATRAEIEAVGSWLMATIRRH